MCAIYGLFLYFFNPPKTLLVSISAVFCLLMIFFIDIYCFYSDKHNLHSDDDKRDK